MAAPGVLPSTALTRPCASRGVFVTGTDTAVGKTLVGCALARLLAERGVRVKVRKPVESGCKREAGHLVPADAAWLLAAAGSDEPLEAVCAYPLEAALSPERAAWLAEVSISRADLKRACLAGVGENDFLLVEGAGGLLAPLAPDALGADLAVDLGLPVLLVVPDRLGCLSHALLTVEAVAARGLALAGVVLNRVQPDHAAGMDNAEDLRTWLRREIIQLPYTAEHEAPWSVWQAPLAPLVERLTG